MALKRKSILLIMIFLIGCFVCACGKKDSVTGESLVEDTEEVSSTEETKSAEEEAAEQWEKGYDLPVDEQEREEAETDCKKLMELYLDIYETADKGIASNVVLDDQMATSRNQPNTKNTDIANDQNRFAKLICLGLVILLCALFLIPHEDKETIKAIADNKLTEAIYRNMVSEQSFDLSLNDWGAVTFVSCMPDPDADANPLTDASFYLIRDGELLYRFPYVAENNVRETGLCEKISFVFSADSNNDLRDDVIIGVQYVSGAGPQGMIPYTEVRIYEDSGNSSFLYNESLSHEINYNLPAESTAEYAKEFLANYSGGQS